MPIKRDKTFQNAALSGKHPLVPHLLDSGANFNTACGEKIPKTALNGDMAIVQLFKAIGADVQVMDDKAPNRAVESRSFALVAHSLKKDPKVNLNHRESPTVSH